MGLFSFFGRRQKQADPERSRKLAEAVAMVHDIDIRMKRFRRLLAELYGDEMDGGPSQFVWRNFVSGALEEAGFEWPAEWDADTYGSPSEWKV